MSEPSDWSRRQVLAALAAAGTAPAWLPLLAGCGAGAGRSRRHAVVPERGMEDVRAQLRQIVTDLEGRLGAASGTAVMLRRQRAVVDGGEQRIESGWLEGGEPAAAAVLRGFDGTSWIEIGGDDLSVAGLDAMAAALLDRARAGAGRPAAAAGRIAAEAAPDRGAAPVSTAATPAVDPREAGGAALLERTAALFERARVLGGSRIVHRVAALETEDREVAFVGEGRDLGQRLVRSWAGALFLAWNGRALVPEEAVRCGAGLEVSGIGDEALERAVEGALALLTGTDAPSGERALVLDGPVAALLLRHGVARGLEADAWPAGARAAALIGRPIAPASVTVTDDPTAADAPGGYTFDDEGWPAAPAALIEGGVLRGPLTDAAAAAALRLPRTGHGRRAGPLAPARPRPAHLALAAGDSEPGELLAAIDDGFLIEGGISGRGDPRSWRFTLRARRAREVARGRLTGRSYGPVVIAGEVPAVLGAVTALGRVGPPVPMIERDEGGARLVSVACPALATRGYLGPGT